MLLALDSSTLFLSLALLDPNDRPSGRRVRAELTQGPPRKQSEMLPGVLQTFLAQEGLRLEDLTALAVGIGPGSFTGLRIGLSAMKALAYARQIELVGVSWLAALCLPAEEHRPLLPLAVARQNELYVGHYQREGVGVREVAPEDALPPAQVARWLLANSEALAFGPALPGYRAALLEAGAPAAQLRDGPEHPLARAVGQLAALTGRYDAQKVFALEPQYVRPSAAERNPKFPPLPGAPATARLRED